MYTGVAKTPNKTFVYHFAVEDMWYMYMYNVYYRIKYNYFLYLHLLDFSDMFESNKNRDYVVTKTPELSKGPHI